MENKISTKKALFGSIGAMILLVASQIIAELIASIFVIIKVPTGICNIMAGMLYLIITYFMLKFFVEKMLKYEMTKFSMPKIKIRVKWIVVAVILPLVVSGVYLLGFKGEYSFSNLNTNQIFASLSSGIFFTGLAAGFVEEMVFRGVIFNLLKERFNKTIAILLPSIIFALVHLIGQDFTIGSCLLVVISGTAVGCMFTLIALESGSVWNSGMVHAMWNIVIIGNGLYIGVKPNEDAVLSYVIDSKSFAVTGGDFGVEASIVSLCAYLAVMLFAYIQIKRNDNVENGMERKIGIDRAL